MVTTGYSFLHEYSVMPKGKQDIFLNNLICNKKSFGSPVVPSHKDIFFSFFFIIEAPFQVKLKISSCFLEKIMHKNQNTVPHYSCVTLRKFSFYFFIIQMKTA